MPIGQLSDHPLPLMCKQVPAVKFQISLSWQVQFFSRYYNFASNFQNCNQASRYSEMVRNIDNNWSTIQQKINSNTNFDFFDDLVQLTREIKNYDKGYFMKTILN